MTPQYPVALLFSVSNGKDVHDDKSNTREVAQYLRSQSVPHKLVEGLHKGKIEVSFVVFGDNAVKLGMELAIKYRQESVVFLNQDRDAVLIECQTGIRTNLGKFRAVPEHIAVKTTGWTYDTATERFFICE